MQHIRKLSLCIGLCALLAAVPLAPVAEESLAASGDDGLLSTEMIVAGEETGQVSRRSTTIQTGHPETFFALGLLHEFGHGVPVDPYRAAQYYYQAAALYAARGEMDHFTTCRDAMRRLNPEHPYLKPLQELITERHRPA